MRSSRWRWHFDEVFVRITGVQRYLWRAVDQEGEVIEAFVSKTWHKKAALKFLRKLMKRHDQAGDIVTDGLRSYGAALKDMGAEGRQVTGRWENNRAENSHQPFRRRERAMLRFRRRHGIQTFAPVHSFGHNLLNSDRCLSSRETHKQARTAALGEWRALCGG
jgi:putative transposase